MIAPNWFHSGAIAASLHFPAPLGAGQRSGRPPGACA